MEARLNRTPNRCAISSHVLARPQAEVEPVLPWIPSVDPVKPVSTSAVAEEDLVPFASPEEGQAYWQQVSQPISRSWARQIRGLRRAPNSDTVKVRFKLLPNAGPS